MTTTLCLACSGTILSPTSTSTSSQHENPLHSSHTTPCCNRPICNRCLSRTKALRFYCIRCQDVVKETGDGAPVDSWVERERWSVGVGEEDEQELNSEKIGMTGEFVIGDDSDDDDAEEGDVRSLEGQDGESSRWDADVITLSDPPPYSNIQTPTPSSPASSPPIVDFDVEGPPPLDDAVDLKRISYADFKPRNLAGEVEMGGKEKGREDERVSMHYIQSQDTLRGLALKYGIDGHHLCILNSLPTSTLTTTPSLLHTRPFLLLPPGTSTSHSPSPPLPPAVEHERLLIRRFQMTTKVSSYGVAKVYVNQALEARKKEAWCVWRNRRNRELGLRVDDEVEDFQDNVEEGNEKRPWDEFVRKGGEVEEAVEMWRKDEEWERKNKGKGKETSLSQEQGAALGKRSLGGVKLSRW